MTTGIYDNCYSCWNSCPADASNKGVCLFSALADADGLRLARNTVITNIDVVNTCREISTASIAHCNVEAAGGVEKERESTVGRVVSAGCVAKERTATGGCIDGADRVAIERIKTNSRVADAGSAAKERGKTDGRIVGAL